MNVILDRINAVRPYWDRYWQGKTPMLSAVTPKDPAHPVPKPRLGITAGSDLDAIADQLLAWEDSNRFHGGAFPFYCVYLFDVYNLTGMFLGGEAEECGVSHRMIPFVDDLNRADLRFNPDCAVADRLRRIVAHLRERCGDRILISACAIAGNLDVLDAIRGSTSLLMDLFDNPEGVHHCLAQIDRAVEQELDFFVNLYDFQTYGSVCRHGMYSRGKVGVPQCDFGYMIGPDHFSRFAYPYLQREFARLDGVCYHLDGIGNLPNLEQLCSDPNLHLIQWVPGTGHDHDDWSGVRETINQLGKGQMLHGSIQDFERWYADHKAPFQFWSIHGSSPEAIAACLNQLD